MSNSSAAIVIGAASKNADAPRFVDITEIFKFAHYGKDVYFAVMAMTPLLHAFLDESADQNQEQGFCIALMLVHENDLKIMQDAWRKRLGVDTIGYFRASDCKAVTGPFGKLRRRYSSLALARQAAMDIRNDLENIILATPWYGLGLCVDVQEYKKGLKIVPDAARFYSEQPTAAAYAQMFYEAGRKVRRIAPKHLADFAIDESSYDGKILDCYRAVKVHHPIIAKSMETIAPFDDKAVPPLQMADLLASVVKDAFLQYKKDGSPFPGKWDSRFGPVFIWNAAHTRRTIRTTKTSRRFLAGKLLSQPTSKPTNRDIKARRKIEIEKEKKRRGL